MKRIALALASLALGAAACGPKRTAAASQPTPAAFDASKSDPKALANVDASLAALGGQDKWNGVKELRFELKYSNGGKLQGWWKHRWDRWNGRHDFFTADADSLATDKVKWAEVRYDLFDESKIPYATLDGAQLTDEDGKKLAGTARQQLMSNAYMLVAWYKAKDPGVHLADAGEITDVAGAPELCKPKCVSVKVTFDPEVGKDTWQIDYNANTHLPELLEKIVDQGRLALKVDGWTDVGGLKFPAKLVNVAVPTETFEFLNVAAGDPTDSYYEAPVDRRGGVSAGNQP
jgi:hypothetical protein